MFSEPPCKNDDLNRFYLAISRDGKYAATFDAATLHVKILKTIDHRELAHFKIKDDDLSIQVYDTYDNPPPSQNVIDRWSIDISNDGNFIFIAASRILEQNMEKENEISTMVAKNFSESNREYCINFSSENATNLTDFKTVIYCLKLNKDVNQVDYRFTKYNYNRLSGICRFAEETKEDVKSDYNLKKFILLNYNGIYSFKYNEKHKTFNDEERYIYPEDVICELKSTQDRTSLLLSYIYKKYFIIEDSKKVLEVYDLGKMKFETSIKIGDDDINLNDKVYSIDKQELQFCIAQGPQSIGIFLMEHGSRIASKSFEKFNIHKIHLIEFINSDEKLFLIVSDSTKDLKFIIWDIYDTDKVDIITLEGLTSQNLSTCFASSSGNILHVNNEGKVISISNMIKIKSEKNNIESNLENSVLEEYIPGFKEPTSFKKLEHHTIYFYAKEINKHDELELAVSELEPWVTNKYEKISFYLCYNDSEVLQLIVGRSTIQIWHQFNDKTKKKKYLPNKGRPFLEFIWTNEIPYNQENEEHKLHIKSVRFGLKNFRLEVYWYEGSSNEKENIKYNEIVKYINHIISRFASKRPQRYRLLDVRYNVMKNLIFGDCNHLIHYLLFGSDMDLYKPKCKFWNEENEEREYIIINETNYANIKIDKANKVQKEKQKYPTTDVNLAIYNCRDRELNDTIIITYILEYYYLFYSEDFANLVKTVSDAYTLCKILNYETYTSIIKNEWHTFVEETTKIQEKDPLKRIQNWVSFEIDLIIKKFKSPENDPKNTKFTK
ncbi:14836_t:CDS:2, partial [Funneliformis geosporum]